jgi:hypothetical protein
MDKPTLKQITAEAERVTDAAWEKLGGQVTDPDALREVVLALDGVKDSLMAAAETANLQECHELGAMYRATLDLQSKVLLRIHEVELVLAANAIFAAKQRLH